ncbi:MAG: hypothetical protein WAR79_15220 [Melioribacteraceae bacterium]
MIKVISDKNDVMLLYAKFRKNLNKYFNSKIDCWVGYPGGSFQDYVNFSNNLDVWLSSKDGKNKYWNGFGIGRPIEHRNNSLSGEINFPKEGIDRKISGVFAKEGSKILVLHRGKIGGGKTGIGKKFFIENYIGDFVTAIDGDRESEFCLVGELDSKFFPNQVSNFINEIQRVKNLLKLGVINTFDDINKFEYSDEQFGRSSVRTKKDLIIERTHGIVANELNRELIKKGKKTSNDKNRDLFIFEKKSITHLFEIKTNSSTHSLYSLVGQLLIYSIPIKNKVKLIGVLPTKLKNVVENKFNSLGIELLYYKWENEKPVFIGLDKYLY